MVYFNCRSDGPDGIILVGLWNTENGHGRITDKSLDKPFVFGNNLCDLPEDTAHDLFDIFRIKPFSHCGVSRHIREQDSDVLSFTFNSWFWLSCFWDFIYPLATLITKP